MKAVIAGGGRTAVYLASLLLDQKHEVLVAEHRPDIVARLHVELPTEVIVEGNALDAEILEHAGIRDADVLIACLSDDADNLLLCFLARSRYGVRRTIAWINNPRHAWLFDEKFHVDVALNQAEILAKLVEEEMSMGDMMVLLKLQRGKFSLVEEQIPAGAKAVGMALRDLVLPPNSVITAVLRGGEMIIPTGDTEFAVGDEVLAIVDPPAADVLAKLFGRPAKV